MRTTLDLNDDLVTQAMALAAEQQTSLARLIEEGLQLRLKASTRRRQARRLPVYRGAGGLMSGVSGLSNKAMLRAAAE